MESELSPDKQKDIPPVPIKTYQWEDLRRSRDAGGYPWTHLLKAPLEGEITAEDIIRETTPRRSMSRDVSRSRTRSPDGEMQKILNLDASPGSSRKHGEEGEDEGVHIPNFSKEVSLESDEDPVATNAPTTKAADSQGVSHLAAPIELPKNVSPKGILKRRVPEQHYNIEITETREKTKCCHPLVNKIKHLADKTLHKLEKTDNEKSPIPKRKKNDESQEIRQLRSSPGAVRRQKFSAIKLGDSDEMSKTMCMETPPPRKNREHIYEDIEEQKVQDSEKTIHFSSDTDHHIRDDDETRSNSNKENDSLTNIEKKSIASQDPSLVTEEVPLRSEEHVMEKLHKMDSINKEAVLLDEEMDPEEPDVDEIFQTQLDDRSPNNESPNITITEITDDDVDVPGDSQIATPIETSPSPNPLDIAKRKVAEELAESEWSKPSSDHEYEIIEKPPPNIIYTTPSVVEKPTMVKTDDELSSTTSLERKYLQHTSDEDDPTEDKENLHENDAILNAEALQKNIEDRFFVNTPSTVSRTECEVSTSQVDSSALEQLPLKRDSRTKNSETTDTKIQQRIKEGTGKLKTQAKKLKTKLQNIKTTKFTTPDRPKINLPERPKFKMPERPKLTPRFTMPDRRKFSLPDRPKFKKINISEKLNLGDRKKFTLPERPKFNVPEMPKFKIPERPKISFPSLGRKKEYKVETDGTGSATELSRLAKVDFEARTYPRWFGKKKKGDIPQTSSSPTLNREDTPPPTFTFTRVKKTIETVQSSSMKPDRSESTQQHNTAEDDNVSEEVVVRMEPRTHFETTYDFDKLDTEYMDEDPEAANANHQIESYTSELSPSKQDHTTVITEINNDEFFVRPRGISREDIQVREYLRDETRQAFRTPKNVLTLMGSSSEVNDDNLYLNDPEEADPELIDDNEPMRYSTEDLNDKDDGYYTFPPVRPSRAKRKKKPVQETEQPTPYIESFNSNMHFTEVDLGHLDIHDLRSQDDIMHIDSEEMINGDSQIHFTPTTDLHSIHEYANDDVIQYPENDIIQSQTLPMPPKRNKKLAKKDVRHSSLSDFKKMPAEELWDEPRRQKHADDIVVYRTEHEYIVPGAFSSTMTATAPAQSPVPPRRTRSRSSRGTSLCDDDRTSHGAESLTLDTQLPHTEPIDLEREIRHESPGYATVDKGPYAPPKTARRSVSKTPPVRRRKSSSSERKYYTVGGKSNMPDRPPRKKSSTSLVTLDSYTKHSDGTQYVEIDDEPFEEVQKDLKSGDIVNKMKDRPLPPPPRPPRGSKKKKNDKSDDNASITLQTDVPLDISQGYPQEPTKPEGVVEIEVSTQTDPLPDDMDFELGYDENLDMSITSSLRDIVDDDSILAKSHSRLGESPRSRPTSRSEKSVKLSDPKISELSKPNIGRTSPTVILVEKRVSSPTRINEREVMVTEASLTVQHIDIDESQIPDVPPLPRPRRVSNTVQSTKNIALPPLNEPNEERALKTMTDATRDIQLDNLVTQRLQVRDLDVGRLNVTELQANKILVSDIEGMTLQVAELDSKSGHISVSGIEFSQSVIDEIVKKFAEISTTSQPPATSQGSLAVPECPGERPVSREEETQTERAETEQVKTASPVGSAPASLSPPPRPEPPVAEEAPAPQRPPPPDLTPLLYSYLQDITIPPAQFYPPRSLRERNFGEFYEHGNGAPAPAAPARRGKRRAAAPHSESSSDDGKVRPSPRRGPLTRSHEPTIAEAGAQFLRVCHNSVSRTLRHMFNSLMSYISGAEDKKDAQMALVIFLVLVAGLIMFGLSDSRTIHHHHWEFFNPPDGKQ